MRIIIVGASGLIGSNLFEAATLCGKNVIGTCKSRMRPGLKVYDICGGPLSPVVHGLKADDTIYLLAAYTHVGWIFNHQQQARSLNVDATRKLIDEAAAAGSRVIFMSSVEVFDGSTGGYKEDAQPRPLTVYGRMKSEIEGHLQQSRCRYTIVRTGWNVGWDLESPCVIKMTYKALLGPGAQMAGDNIFSISDVRDTAHGLLKLSDTEEMKICHLASNPGIVRSQLAWRIMKYSEHRDAMSFKEVLFSQIPYQETRGRDTHLDNALTLKALGIICRRPEEIIRRKVALLDQNYALI